MGSNFYKVLRKMSTRATIKYTDNWHLYEELMDEYPENIHLRLNRRDFDGTIIAEDFRIPWEAAEALYGYVKGRLAHEANLRDPQWLQNQIWEAQAELSELDEREGALGGILRIGLENRIERYQERLDKLTK